MARALTAYISRNTAPARPALQAAVDQLRFKITLDDGYAPFKTAGYLPCTLDGEDAGFDMRFQDVPADIPSDAKTALGDRDTAIAFRWAGDPREELAALAVVTALAREFGAVVHDPDKDKILSADDLLKKARAAQEQL